MPINYPSFEDEVCRRQMQAYQMSQYTMGTSFSTLAVKHNLTSEDIEKEPTNDKLLLVLESLG